VIRCQTTTILVGSISSWKILLGEIGIGKTQAVCFFQHQTCTFPHSVHLLNLCLVGGWVGGRLFYFFVFIGGS
jgi:hypothetical protein